MIDPRLAAWPPDATDGSLVVSASRLKNIGGEKGDPGCTRRYAGAYLFDMKQASSGATDLGTAVHSVAQHYQATGEVPEPESDAGVIFAAGAHLVNYTGRLLVEHEHVGLLPDGTPFVAYLDGHSPHGKDTACVVILGAPAEAAGGAVVVQDIKTTGSGERYALEAGEGSKGLRRDLQAMFYAWVILCLPHWFCPPLPDGHAGPKHWQWWDPEERAAKTARLRWLYFQTKGTPRAWEATDWVTPTMAADFMQTSIMPLVAQMKAVHEAVARGIVHTVNEFDRNIEATCKWCGVNERQACEYGTLGTPATDLIQLKRRPQMTPQERLAALKAGHAARAAGATTAAAAPAPEAAPASPPPEAAPTPPPSATAAPSPEALTSTTADVAALASVTAAPSAPAARGRGRPRTRPPATPPGAGINPPEVVEALAKLQPEGPSGAVPTQTGCGIPTTDALQVAAQLARLLPSGMALTVQGTKS